MSLWSANTPANDFLPLQSYQFRIAWRREAWSVKTSLKMRTFRRRSDALRFRESLLRKHPDAIVQFDKRRILASRWEPEGGEG